MGLERSAVCINSTFDAIHLPVLSNYARRWTHRYEGHECVEGRRKHMGSERSRHFFGAGLLCLRTNLSTPVFCVSRISVKNRLLKGSPKIVRSDEGNLVIDVRTISFKDYPARFRYRLSADAPWLPVSGGSIFLSGLRPGSHDLEIQSSSTAGVWDWNQVAPLRSRRLGGRLGTSAYPLEAC